MLWLKKLDPLSHLIPGILIKGRGPATGEKSVAILRPGGLGDLVLLSRAALELGINPSSAFWICERRNAHWARYLRLPHRCYDTVNALREIISGRSRFGCVINSEQTFGLSTLYSARLCASDGRHIGFSSNRRAELYSSSVVYSHHVHELESFKSLLRGAGLEGGDVLSQPCEAREFRRGVCVVALAGLQVPGKQLPVEAWKRVLRAAEGRFNEIYLVGAPGDSGFAGQLGVREHGPIVNLVGKISFEAVVELIRGAERLVSVDSGLVHVADYFGVPASVYFPSGNIAKWRPLNSSSRVYHPSEREAFFTLD